jgi:taurine--2-oxoglutarate transaminase
LTSGYLPLGATITRKHIGDRFKALFFSHGATYAGHTLGCTAALAVISVYQTDHLIENSSRMGKYLFERAMELKENHQCVGDVRGMGLLVGLELVKNRKTKEPLTAVNAKVRKGMNPKLEMVKKLGELGMMTMAANPSNVVVMAPPLIVTKDEIDEGISKMDRVLSIGDVLTES